VTVLIIFPVILQTVINLRMLSIEGQECASRELCSNYLSIILAQYITKTKLAAYMKQMYQNAFVVWLQSYKLEEIIATVPPPQLV